MAKTKDSRLCQINEYLESVKAKLRKHYQDIMLKEGLLTADSVKDAFLEINSSKKEEHSVTWLYEQHSTVMAYVLKPGTL